MNVERIMHIHSVNAAEYEVIRSKSVSQFLSCKMCMLTCLNNIFSRPRCLSDTIPFSFPPNARLITCPGDKARALSIS